MIRFTVIEEVADDPESRRVWNGISPAGIRAEWPLFAALFPDDCENAYPTLDFTADVNRWRISPEL